MANCPHADQEGLARAPMKDKTVAILESRAGDRVASLIRKYGGTPFLAPALAEVPDVDPERIRALLGDWASIPPDMFIFQTGVGTRALFAATDSMALSPALLRMLEASKVVVRRYGETNRELEAALESEGASVTEIATYRWAVPEDTAPLVRLIDALGRGAIDLVAFTSASQASNLFTVAQGCGKEASLKQSLERTLIASIGPVCSATLRKLAVRVDVEAKPPKLGPFIDVINAALSDTAKDRPAPGDAP